MFMGQPFSSLSSEQEMKHAVSTYLVCVRDYRRRSRLTFDVSLDSASIDEDSESDEAELEEDSDDSGGEEPGGEELLYSGNCTVLCI